MPRPSGFLITHWARCHEYALRTERWPFEVLEDPRSIATFKRMLVEWRPGPSGESGLHGRNIVDVATDVMPDGARRLVAGG